MGFMVLNEFYFSGQLQNQKHREKKSCKNNFDESGVTS